MATVAINDYEENQLDLEMNISMDDDYYEFKLNGCEFYLTEKNLNAIAKFFTKAKRIRKERCLKEDD